MTLITIITLNIDIMTIFKEYKSRLSSVVIFLNSNDNLVITKVFYKEKTKIIIYILLFLYHFILLYKIIKNYKKQIINTSKKHFLYNPTKYHQHQYSIWNNSSTWTFTIINITSFQWIRSFNCFRFRTRISFIPSLIP